jgi:hypothetical protein
MTEVDQAVELLDAIFIPGDVVLFRPIETWTDGDRRRSHVDFQGIVYHRHGVRGDDGTWRPHRGGLADVVHQQMERTTTTRCNLFYGVAPRFDARHYDEAWAVRTVRALWCDIDDVTDDDAILRRCVEADLPEPSAMVMSGHGLHVYWLLRDPYVIDDADDPPPVFVEFIEANGRRKPRKYIKDATTGERLSLDGRQNVPALSDRAVHLQDILAGIAAQVGADHTTDLSRLMRVPGSLNRKGERNGAQPTPCTLLYLHADQRHAVEDFEHVVRVSPTRKRRDLVRQIQLPTPKRLTPTKRDKLHEIVAACAIAPIGSRSEVDWALVCAAVEHGWPKEEVWEAVASVGKFADSGRRYFDHTWSRAEDHTREVVFVRLERKTAKSATTTSTTTADDDRVHGGGDDADDGDRPVIRISPGDQDVGDVMSMITDRMIAAGCFYHRTRTPVMIRGDEILMIDAPQQLGGILNAIVEFALADDKSERRIPLPVAYATTWLHHPHEFQRLPEITLLTRNPVYTQGWRLVAPGYDRDTGIYYIGPRVEPRPSTAILDAVLDGFCFETRADRANYLGMLITTLLISKFREAKPGVLFTANQASTGKSKLAQIVGVVRDGQPVRTASYTIDDSEMEKRLGSIVYSGATVIIIDNAKRYGRSPTIASAVLERSITDLVLSYRLLGHSRDIAVENSHIFAITANSPHVSRDLITRCVPVRLHYEGNPAKRRFAFDPVHHTVEHRVEILGELCGMVEAWKSADMPLADHTHRFDERGWARIVGGILRNAGVQGFLDNMEDAAILYDRQRQQVGELVAYMATEPERGWRVTELVDACHSLEILADDITDGGRAKSIKAQTTRLGLVLSQYIREVFEVADGSKMTLQHRFVRGKKRYCATPVPAT